MAEQVTYDLSRVVVQTEMQRQVVMGSRSAVMPAGPGTRKRSRAGMSVGHPGPVDSALRGVVAGRTLRRRAYRGEGGLELSGRGLELAHGGAHIT